MPKNTQLLLLDTRQVAALLNYHMVIDAVADAFKLHSGGAGRIFPVVREGLGNGAVFGIKSGDIDSRSVLGFKAAGFWQQNRTLGAEPHQATILLIDPESGRPHCVIDGNIVTTLRTGAAGALGLGLFARPDSRVLCVFGSGVQAQIQTRFALRAVPTLRHVIHVSRDGRPAPDFEAALAADLETAGATLAHTADADAAVAASDIVITATPGRKALFHAEAVRPGTHINAVGADTQGKRELPDGLLARARIFVDDPIQARQIGECQWAPELAITAIGDLLAGTTSFTRQAEDITVFDMTGIALQDLTVAHLLLREAKATGAGTRVDWPW
ncbi:ornithine cyclodeaminase family protein [Propionivibrio dicarboxylicus]|uniref:Ornithine cyclodeaminase n=1 Tax=Propionivibrio dicarboxylicus TaxID=83767 RepID=A0A1G8A8U1_9RHOO|nr:ornithine cyclodeaminase family protein [Propionivibrio dicarboxylicus]SDH17287.1 ornithine cyclodeaminase [Propionivibrio dicarboxylicus]